MAVQEIRVGNKVYRFEGITPEEAEVLAREALTDPVTQTASVNPDRNMGEAEIGYKPGVTDPIEQSLLKAAAMLGIAASAASSSEIYASDTAPRPSQIQRVIEDKPQTLAIENQNQPVEIITLRQLSDDELLRLSGERSLFLNLAEMQTLRQHYLGKKRDPSDVELETFAQTWSEHCKHKTFKAILVDETGQEKLPLMERIKNASIPHFERVGVVSAFADNAGGIRLADGWVVVGKGETHNSPVAIDPYAGAATKNGGVFRDIAGFGQGAENLMALMINNFGPPGTAEKDIPPGCLHPQYLLRENSRGEREYGNPMGIPTHAISLHFHPDFIPKPTSLGVVIGMTPEKYAYKETPRPGDLVVVLGGKTGRDGLHGATFSSGEMSAATQTVHGSAVQLGDPITEKTMFDALLSARDANLIRSVTDCGAGGFSSAIGEMAAGVGAIVDLDLVPTKYQGLAAWEKWLSESQERMVVAVAPEHWEALKQICDRFDTTAAIVGRFSSDNHLHIQDQGNLVAYIDLEFLHHGLPQRRMKYVSPNPEVSEATPSIANFAETFKAVLGHLNVCSKETMHRRYDQTVQGRTVLSPFVGVNQDIPSDASVLAPFPDQKVGIVTAFGLNPLLMRQDPYHGGTWAFALATSRYVAAGGDISSACGIDNFIWPFPDETSLGDLDQAVEALCDMIQFTGIPFVSGKDSLSSTYRGKDRIIKAPPTLNVTIFGRIENYETTLSPDFKQSGSTIALIGRQDLGGYGGSVLTDVLQADDGRVPRVDTANLPQLLTNLHQAVADKQILAAKAVGEGGVAVALSQMCLGGGRGAAIDLATSPETLFNETSGTILVEVESLEILEQYFADLPYQVLGRTTAEPMLEINSRGDTILSESLESLAAAWKEPFKYE